MTYSFFRGLQEGEFLFVADQFLRFSFRETFVNSFFLRELAYLGSHSSWQISVQYLDTLVHLLMFSIGLSFKFVEIVIVFLSIFLSLNLSFVGYRKLATVLEITQKDLPVLVTTLWYCFNPYTLELWHGGVYNIGAALTYSLAPLSFYYIHILLKKDIKKFELALLGLILAVSFFTFWFFASFVLFVIFYVLMNLRRFLSSFRGFVAVFLLSLPLIIHMVFAVLFEYFGIRDLDSAAFVPTYGSQQGGIWYQVLMYFSWGIYNVWHPRGLYSFGEYFFSPQYIVSVCLTYVVALFGVFRSFRLGKVRIFLVKIATILFLGLFFAKGAQYPLGGIFEFLYKNVPFFNVFRTPDIRFGFVVVLALAILILNASKFMNKFIYAFLIIALILFQVPQFFTGIVFRGEEVPGRYYDRVVSVPKDYEEVVDFLNSDTSFSYVLPLPSVEYGYFALGPENIHVGQDMLQKLAQRPFFYTNSGAGSSRRTIGKLDSMLIKQDFTNIREFPVKHILIRNDVVCPDCVFNFDFESNFPLRFENDLFRVYEVESHSNVVSGSSASFDFVNPTKFAVTYMGLRTDENLNFLMTYNKWWELYLLPEQGKFGVPKRVFGDSHNLLHGYANTWEIDPEVIKGKFSRDYYDTNEDGSINFRLAIYYTPQLWFNAFHIISAVSFFALLWFIVRRNNEPFFKH